MAGAGVPRWVIARDPGGRDETVESPELHFEIASLPSQRPNGQSFPGYTVQ